MGKNINTGFGNVDFGEKKAVGNSGAQMDSLYDNYEIHKKIPWGIYILTYVIFLITIGGLIWAAIGSLPDSMGYIYLVFAFVAAGYVLMHCYKNIILRLKREKIEAEEIED